MPVAAHERQQPDAAPPGRQAIAPPGFEPLRQRPPVSPPATGSPGMQAQPAARGPRAPLPQTAHAEDAKPTATLVWPDGRKSAGQVCETPEGPVFEIASATHDAVLARRGRKQPAGWHNARPRPLPVAAASGDSTGRKFVPRLPPVLSATDFNEDGSLPIGRNYHQRPLGDHAQEVEACRLISMQAQCLGRLAKVAGGWSEGTPDEHLVALQHLFGRSLDAIAAQCTDPRSVSHVAQALSEEDSALWLVNFHSRAARDPTGFTKASFDALAFRERLAKLAPEQHWYVRVIAEHDGFQYHSHKKVATSGHSLGMGIQKQPDGNFRVSVINPNGWTITQPKGKPYSVPWHNWITDRPAVFKTVTLNDADTAMQDLLSNRWPIPPRELPKTAWTDAALGQPLLAWLQNMGPAEARLSADFHGNGRPLVSARQKRGDCGIESLFAFMATALQRADYKLAKAACLATLMQIVDRLEVPESRPTKLARAIGLLPEEPLQVTRSRLQQRLTTSLSGAMVAPASPRPAQ